MVSLILIRPVVKKLNFSRFRYHGLKLYSTKTSKPLRILFCGSDEFSIASLRAIYAEHKRDPDLIKSIDVLCRPGKPAGRSLKQIREVPIKAVAQELGLALHERDTFTGWDLPKPNDEDINLIVAVSFGLFVPPRILKAVEYGGLNVHPSLLPDYRGPAPLQHMIMKREETTGVTLQTLDDKSFDRGKILAQEWFPLQPKTTYQSLLEMFMPKAAKILVSGLQNRLFVPPLAEDTRWQHMLPKQLTYAAKITPDDRKISWHPNYALEEIPLRHLALGRLWTSVLVDPKTPKRLIIEDSETVNRPAVFRDETNNIRNAKAYQQRILRELGRSIHFFVENNELRVPVLYVEDGSAVIFLTPRKAIRVKRITIEGEETKDASMAMESLRRADAWRLKMAPRPGNDKFVALPKDPDAKEVNEISQTGK